MPSLVMRNRTPKGMTADEPKKRLIEAGLDLFGKYSFDGASTRMLAERAQVNLASIKYYFGGKEGLYLAVAGHIVEEIEVLLGPRIAEVQKALKKRYSLSNRASGSCASCWNSLLPIFSVVPRPTNGSVLSSVSNCVPLKLLEFCLKAS